MRILSLIFLLLSTQVFAGYDWQYSIKHPDGRIETKNIQDSDGFFFKVGEHLCSVSESDETDDEDNDEQYDLKCLSENEGLEMKIKKPENNVPYVDTYPIHFLVKKKPVWIELVVFNHNVKKDRKVFESWK